MPDPYWHFRSRHQCTVDVQPLANVLPNTISIENYDPKWPELFRREADRIRAGLGDRVYG